MTNKSTTTTRDQSRTLRAKARDMMRREQRNAKTRVFLALAFGA